MANLPMGSTLNQLSISKARTFVEQVDNVTEEAPIVKAMPFKQSTDQLWDVSTELKLVSGAKRVDLNAPLPSIQMADGTKQTNLNIFGATMFVPEVTALLHGGAAKYFATNRKSFERQTGSDMEKSYIYDAFLPFALANNKITPGIVQNAGGAANKNYSLLVVRFDDVNLSGLYSPLAFKKDTFLDMQAINGGNLYANPDSTSDYYNALGYGIRMLTFVGVRMLSPRNVSGIVNIDADAATPLTKKMIQTALLKARIGTAGKAMIICHPTVKLLLEDIGKIQQIETSYSDKNANFRLETWDGVPIVASYNFMDATETNISL